MWLDLRCAICPCDMTQRKKIYNTINMKFEPTNVVVQWASAQKHIHIQTARRTALCALFALNCNENVVDDDGKQCEGNRRNRELEIIMSKVKNSNEIKVILWMCAIEASLCVTATTHTQPVFERMTVTKRRRSTSTSTLYDDDDDGSRRRWNRWRCEWKLSNCLSAHNK